MALRIPQLSSVMVLGLPLTHIILVYYHLFELFVETLLLFKIIKDYRWKGWDSSTYCISIHLGFISHSPNHRHFLWDLSKLIRAIAVKLGTHIHALLSSSMDHLCYLPWHPRLIHFGLKRRTHRHNDRSSLVKSPSCGVDYILSNRVVEHFSKQISWKKYITQRLCPGHLQLG